MRIDTLIKTVWRKLNPIATDTWLASVMGILLRLSGLVLLAFSMMILWGTINTKGYAIEAISVPESLSKNGMTGRVVALHLHDAIEQIKKEAATVKQDKLEFDQEENQPLNVSVMGVQMSISSIAYQLRQLLGKEQKRIAGEIIQSGDKLSLTFRLSRYPNVHFEEQVMDGDAEAAVEQLLRKASMQVLENIDPYRLAVLHFRARNSDKAIEVCKKAIEERPEERPWMYFAWGFSLASSKEYDAAIQKVKTAIELDSTFALPYTFMAHCQMQKGQFEEASKSLTTGLSIDSTMVDAWSNLAWILNKNKDTVSAYSAYKKAALLSTGTDKEVRNWLTWSNSALANNNLEGVNEIANLAMNKIGEKAITFIARANTLLLEKDTLAAVEAIETAISLDSKNINAIMNGIFINAMQKNHARVIELQENYVNSEETSAQSKQYALNYSAMAYNAQGKHAIAFEKINEAIALSPNTGVLYSTLAETYAFTGNQNKFYNYLDTAAQKGYVLQTIDWNIEPYRTHKDKFRMKNLITKHSIKG